MTLKFLKNHLFNTSACLRGEGCLHTPMVKRSRYIRIKNHLHKHFAGMRMVGGRGQKSWTFSDVLNGWSPIRTAPVSWYRMKDEQFMVKCVLHLEFSFSSIFKILNANQYIFWLYCEEVKQENASNYLLFLGGSLLINESSFNSLSFVNSSQQVLGKVKKPIRD